MPPRTPRLLSATLFPTLLALAATLYLTGRLGKNTDDYSINLRDAASSALPTPFNPLARFMFLWRPLHNAMRYTVGTLWPDGDRPVHIFIALAHLAACLMLWRVLRQLTRTHIAPAIAALLFMVIPLHGEVVCWFNTTSTAIAAAACLAALSLSIRYARASTSRPALLLAIAAITFLVPCFYEQSAALAAAIPFACLAVSSAHSWRTRLTRALAATTAAALPCLLYILLLRATAPAEARGGAASFVSLSSLPARLTELLHSTHSNLCGQRAHDLLLGSIKLGAQTVATPTGLVCGALLLAAATLWLIWAHTEPPRSRGSPADHTPTNTLSHPTLYLALSGLAIFLAAFLPILIIDHQIVESRNLYIPLMGAACVLAALIDLLCSTFPHPVLRTTIATLTVVASIPGTLGLIGFQALFQSRSDLDQRELTQLHTLFPNPPANTIFVPLRTAALAAHTGYPMFDRARGGVFETPWSSSDAIKRLYHRHDLDAASTALSAPTEHSLQWNPSLGRARSETTIDHFAIPWDSMIPFITTDNPNPIQLIRHITIERPDHRDLHIHPSLITEALAAHHAPSTTYLYIDGEPGPDLIPINFWEHADSTPIKLDDMWMWSNVPSNLPARPRRATRLAATPGPRQSMSVSMPPLDRPERLLLRATIAPYDLDLTRNPSPPIQELVVTMHADPTKELAVLRLDPKHFRRTQAWLPLIVPLPPRPPPAGDRIVITIRRAADDPSPPNSPSLPIWITPGYEQSIPLNQSPSSP